MTPGRISPTGLSDSPKWPPIARSTDPQTSADAGAQITAGGRRESQAGRILAAIRETPGLTIDDLAARLELDNHKVGKRTSDLKNLGLIYQAGAKPGGDGCAQGIWWPAVDQLAMGL